MANDRGAADDLSVILLDRESIDALRVLLGCMQVTMAEVAKGCVEHAESAADPQDKGAALAAAQEYISRGTLAGRLLDTIEKGAELKLASQITGPLMLAAFSRPDPDIPAILGALCNYLEGFRHPEGIKRSGALN